MLPQAPSPTVKPPNYEADRLTLSSHSTKFWRNLRPYSGKSLHYVEATVLPETVGNFNQTVQGLISEDGIIMWTPLHSQISQFLKLF
jgi:hypothetical protein